MSNVQEKLNEILDAIEIVLSNYDSPMELEELSHAVNETLGVPINSELLQRAYLKKYFEKFIQTKDGKWGLMSWDPQKLEEQEKEFSEKLEEITKYEDLEPYLPPQLTPSGAFEYIKESLVQYLETQYKIANTDIFAERGEILRSQTTVAQDPFIEATPAFMTSKKLSDLEREHTEIHMG